MGDLKHYGILGMKWGVRRSPEQLGRRDKSSMSDDELRGKVSRMQLESRYKELSKPPMSNFRKNLKSAVGVAGGITKVATASSELKGGNKVKVDAVNNIVKNSGSITETVSKLKGNASPKDVATLSDAALKAKVERMNLERLYDSLEGNTNTGTNKVNSILETSGGILAATSSALAIALAIRALRATTGA